MAYKPDLSAGNLLASALGGIAAALGLSYFGAAGSLIGAALAPVLYILTKELARGAAEEAAARAAQPLGQRRETGRGSPGSGAPADGGRPAPPEIRVYQARWRRRRVVAGLATAGLATLIAVTVITIPELIAGESLTTDRRTTLFHPGRSGETTPLEEEAPTETTTTTTTETPVTVTTTETVPALPPEGGTTSEEAPADGTTEAPAEEGATEAPAEEGATGPPDATTETTTTEAPPP